ncbi:MAG: class C sortase [Tissierellia bacterium]|nr:class C sortase [Tissierellia bacterium]
MTKAGRRKNKKRIGLGIIALGLALLLYPLTSIVYHDLSGEMRKARFLDRERSISEGTMETRRQQTQSYNAGLDGSADTAVDPFDVKGYTPASTLEFGEGEVFGYLSIPRIGEELPIYIGASEYHLSIGTAQVDGTNMPIGGVNTRSVIAGHRGYATQTIFRDVDVLEPGDQILIHALGEELEYAVTDAQIIAPSEYGKLAVIPGQDTLTLLTCTPYMVFTERLLVNAVRVNAPVSTAEEPTNTSDETPAAKPDSTESVTPIAEEPSADRTDRQQAVAPSILWKKRGLFALTIVLWLALFRTLYRLTKSFGDV